MRFKITHVLFFLGLVVLTSGCVSNISEDDVEINNVEWKSIDNVDRSQGTVSYQISVSESASEEVEIVSASTSATEWERFSLSPGATEVREVNSESEGALELEIRSEGSNSNSIEKKTSLPEMPNPSLGGYTTSSPQLVFEKGETEVTAESELVISNQGPIDAEVLVADSGVTGIRGEGEVETTYRGEDYTVKIELQNSDNIFDVGVGGKEIPIKITATEVGFNPDSKDVFMDIPVYHGEIFEIEQGMTLAQVDETDQTSKTQANQEIGEEASECSKGFYGFSDRPFELSVDGRNEGPSEYGRFIVGVHNVGGEKFSIKNMEFNGSNRNVAYGGYNILQNSVDFTSENHNLANIDIGYVGENNYCQTYDVEVTYDEGQLESLSASGILRTTSELDVGEESNNEQMQDSSDTEDRSSSNIENINSDEALDIASDHEKFPDNPTDTEVLEVTAQDLESEENIEDLFQGNLVYEDSFIASAESDDKAFVVQVTRQGELKGYVEFQTSDDQEEQVRISGSQAESIASEHHAHPDEESIEEVSYRIIDEETLAEEGSLEELGPNFKDEESILVASETSNTAFLGQVSFDGYLMAYNIFDSNGEPVEKNYGREITVKARNMEFEPDSVDVSRGETIRFNLEVEKSSPFLGSGITGTTHNLRIPQKEVGTETVSTGNSDYFITSFEEKGLYNFESTIGYQADNGMTGTITVE